MFDIIRNPTVIATFLSLGVHGLLGLSTPVLVGSFSSNKDDGKNAVGVVKLSSVEQNRIPGFVPNSNNLNTLPGLTLPSDKSVQTLPLLPPIPPLKSLQTPSTSPNPNLNLTPSQLNIISSQNKFVTKIPSNPNIPPINVDQIKTLDPQLEPLPNIGSITGKKNKGQQPKQLANTKSTSKPDIKSSSSDNNQPKNNFLSRNINLKEPSEIGNTTVLNDEKPKGKTPSSKNLPPNIKSQKNNNEQLAFNKNTGNQIQDPRFNDDGPSFSQPEEINPNKPEKNPERNINRKRTKTDKNRKKPAKIVKTKTEKKRANRIGSKRNTPNNSGIPIFENQTLNLSQFDSKNREIDMKNTDLIPDKPNEDEKKTSSNLASNSTSVNSPESEKKYNEWAKKNNTNLPKERYVLLHPKYPTDACFKNTKTLEGTVILAVLVDKNGKIQDETAGIIESSGYPILDNGAIKDVKKIKLENKTDQPKPYSVEIKYEYPEKGCLGRDTNNNKVKQSDENNETTTPNQKELSRKKDENNPSNPNSNEDQKIEILPEQNTEHSEQN